MDEQKSTTTISVVHLHHELLPRFFRSALQIREVFLIVRDRISGFLTLRRIALLEISHQSYKTSIISSS